MKNIQFPVYFTTAFLLVYTLLPFFKSTEVLIMLLFSISPFLVIWMVIRVLKDGKPSGRKFSDGYLYDDISYPLFSKEKRGGDPE